MCKASWKDITDTERVGAATDVYDHKTRVYIECSCGTHFDWWSYDGEVRCCPTCSTPYRSSVHYRVEVHE